MLMLRHRKTIAVLTLMSGLLGGTAVARACALDQRPSVYADGQLARSNTQVPTTAAQLAAWAPFVFPRTYQAGRAVTFTEDRREVARSLAAAAMRRPWRWQFGDGQLAYGWTVRHTYGRAGSWRITVDAYDPGTARWYTFDQALIAIHR
jgi:hypothetical protein